jgi:hypothetical protein
MNNNIEHYRDSGRSSSGRYGGGNRGGYRSSGYRSSSYRSSPSSYRSSRSNVVQRAQKTQTSTTTTLGGTGGGLFFGWGYPNAYINCNNWDGNCYLDQYIPHILYPYGVLPIIEYETTIIPNKIKNKKNKEKNKSL